MPEQDLYELLGSNLKICILSKNLSIKMVMLIVTFQWLLSQVSPMIEVMIIDDSALANLISIMKVKTLK